MNILIGLLIIAVGAFCQSSSYVPINKIKKWSWESYWLIQGVFAWLVFPILGALLAVDKWKICIHAALEAVEVTPRACIAATECTEIGRRVCS